MTTLVSSPITATRPRLASGSLRSQTSSVSPALAADSWTSWTLVSIHDVESVLALLELTNKLDDEIAHGLIALGAPLDFDEAIYEHAYRRADHYAERVRQIDLVIVALSNVHRLGRKRLLGLALQSTHGLAHAVGMGAIHRFLRLGYQVIQPVRDITRFLDTIETREKARLDRIYAARE
jgi:hypothetical protein